MISNEMKELVANSSTIRAMFEEGKRLASIHGAENVYDYSLGNPNVEPPESIKKAIEEILHEESPKLIHGYMNNSGYEDVRNILAAHINQLYKTDVTQDNLVMTCGAAGGLNILLKTLLNPDDEVIVFAPFFGEYKNYVKNYAGRLVVVPADIETFEPNIEALKEKITDKTKVVIINSPNNPTGVVYSEKAIKALADTLAEQEKIIGHPIYLISDEPYREIVYDGVKVPYLINYYKNSFVGYSYSKSLSLPGERIGYIVAGSQMDGFEEIMTALNVANRILGFVNAPSLFQRVIAKTLGSEVDISIYQKNRDLLYGHLVDLGFRCVKPEGAFYLFPRTPIEDDKAFCQDAKEFNLLLVPGTAFGCPGHVRLSYCISYEQIERSLPAFEKLAAKYGVN